MPSLAELQFTMAADLLDGGQRIARLLPGDSAAVITALRIHRNTVLAGLANALRLTYPTVAWLTGEDFFDQAAVAFAARNPPRGACLSDYGDGFADFLDSYPPASGFSYLGDVARFDLVIERCAQSPVTQGHRIMLDGGVMLTFCGSLVTLAVEYPADALRDARDQDDAERLATLDMTPCARNYAIWRGGQGVSVRSLGAPAAAFLGAVLRGESGEAALRLTLLHSEAQEALAAIQAEIFTAPFTTIQAPGIQTQGTNP